MRTGSAGLRKQGGFTYLGVLFLVALMGGLLASAGQLWATQALRERERELLWVGGQYAQALRSYYRSSPGVAQYPAALEDLLEDNRFPSPQRHLRRLYRDPLTGNGEWGLVRSVDGRIAGVYSLSRERPLKQDRFPAPWSDFAGMNQYTDWQFVAEQAFLDTGASGPAAAGGQAHAPSP
ncbi:hypothetical protein D9M68_150150 [compost metagenome]